MTKILWNDILSRLTGLNIWILGASWTPTALESEVAERVVTFLENEGLLYIAYDWEHPEDCHRSADKIRDGLIAILTTLPPLPRDKPVFANTHAIRVGCADFMRALERNGLHRMAYESMLSDSQKAIFYSALGTLRNTCGIHIGIIAAAHKIDLDERLASILPSAEADANEAEQGS